MGFSPARSPLGAKSTSASARSSWSADFPYTALFIRQGILPVDTLPLRRALAAPLGRRGLGGENRASMPPPGRFYRPAAHPHIYEISVSAKRSSSDSAPWAYRAAAICSKPQLGASCPETGPSGS